MDVLKYKILENMISVYFNPFVVVNTIIIEFVIVQFWFRLPFIELLLALVAVLSCVTFSRKFDWI